MTFSRTELTDARAVVATVMSPTPQYRWPLLCAAVGTDVVVKHENHTPTGAFKVRGGLVYAERLRRRRPHVTGLVSATRGNHGQSIAFAGAAAGVPVTIVVPHGNSADKNAAMRGFGAELVVHGHDFQAAREHAALLADERGLEAVPSYHPDLVLGVATYAAELFEAVADLDVVYVPIGMGSGICGLIRVRDLLGLRTEIVGVVAERPGDGPVLRGRHHGHHAEREDLRRRCRLPGARPGRAGHGQRRRGPHRPGERGRGRGRDAPDVHDNP